MRNTNSDMSQAIFEVLNVGMSNSNAASKLTDDIVAALEKAELDYDSGYGYGVTDGYNMATSY